MSASATNFMKSILGEDGQQAFEKMSHRAPALAALLTPRTVLSWLSMATMIDYEGEIPGVDNSFLSLAKSNDGIDGSLVVGDIKQTFIASDLLHVAAAISHAIGVESVDIDPSIKSTDISRLGKSIDLLVKARTIAYVAGEEMTKFAVSPTRMTTHGDFHVVHTPGRKFPYSVHHNATDELVQGNISSLNHAQVIANWHARKPINKTELPGQAAAARPPKEAEIPQAPMKQPQMKLPPKPPMMKREIMIKHIDADKKCKACGQVQFEGGNFTGCFCFRALSKSVSTKKTDKGYVLQLNHVYWDEESVHALISAFRG